MECDSQINVSQLLKSKVGTVKMVQLVQTFPNLGDIESTVPVSGTLQLTRTDQGIWVSGEMDTCIALDCSRCVVQYNATSKIEIDDEFLPSIDIQTGAKIRYSTEENLPITNSIDAQHILDLDETIRQYCLANMPIAPLCKVDCKGLCTECGVDLNVSSCSCEQYQDRRWEKLRELLNK